jgi:acetolactate synthase-1/2/3 large subunit
VTSTEDLTRTLEASFEAGGVHLVAVAVDYSENTRVLVEELGSRASVIETS